MPTENSLKKSMRGAFSLNKISQHLDEVDSCCKWFHKCNAYEKSNIQKNESDAALCNCIQRFRKCLNELGTDMSKKIANLTNKIECHEVDHQVSSITGICFCL